MSNVDDGNPTSTCFCSEDCAVKYFEDYGVGEVTHRPASTWVFGKGLIDDGRALRRLS